jgi:hypothetical protein
MAVNLLVFKVAVLQMMVILWVYELHTEHSFSIVSKECTVSTFRVTELV